MKVSWLCLSTFSSHTSACTSELSRALLTDYKIYLALFVYTAYMWVLSTFSIGTSACISEWATMHFSLKCLTTPTLCGCNSVGEVGKFTYVSSSFQHCIDSPNCERDSNRSVVLVAAKEFTGTRLLSSILQQIKISSLPGKKVFHLCLSPNWGLTPHTEWLLISSLQVDSKK